MRKPIIAIWAEEIGPKTDGKFEYSFGNGADGDDFRNIGVSIPSSGRIIRGGLSAVAKRGETGAMTVGIVINGVESGYKITKPDSVYSGCSTFATPLEIYACDSVKLCIEID